MGVRLTSGEDHDELDESPDAGGEGEEKSDEEDRGEDPDDGQSELPPGLRPVTEVEVVGAESSQEEGQQCGGDLGLRRGELGGGVGLHVVSP